MTSCSCALSPRSRVYTVPMSHGMTCPENSTSRTRGRMLPHGDSSQAHTPSRLDSHRSIASKNRSVMVNMGWLRLTGKSSACAPEERTAANRRKTLTTTLNMPGLLLGDVFPDFEADTTTGKIKLHQFLGDSWGVLFSHPRDYTPVCTTELGRAARLSSEFSKRDVKMIALSIDCLENHHGWTKDILAYNCDDSSCSLPFPIIADSKRELAVALGMLDPDEKDKDGMPLTARCVFIIGPDKKLKLSFLYPATTGRNFDEILRVVDSLQITAGKRVATPADWKPGDCVMVPPNMSEEEAASLFPDGVYTKDLPSGKKYLRYTPQP